jgi:hypothetical protein
MIREFTTRLADGTWEDGAFCLLDHKEYNTDNRSMVMIERYHGLVLREFERNYHDDSDFMAVVWDEAAQEPKTVMWATTRGWTYPCSCVVDATPKILAKYGVYLEKRRLLWTEYNQKLEKLIPKVGMVARATVTRGKAKGKQGEITWIGDSNYSTNKLVRLNSDCYVEVNRIELWDETTEEWVKPATYSRTFRIWTVPENVIANPDRANVE